MKHIQKIQIKNFKSFNDLTIEGCKKINIIIGSPNTGKSNLLEALSLFAISNSINLKKRIVTLQDYIRIKKANHIFFNGNTEKESSIILNEENRMYIRTNDEGKELYFFNFLLNKSELDIPENIDRLKIKDNNYTDYYNYYNFFRGLSKYYFEFFTQDFTNFNRYNYNEITNPYCIKNYKFNSQTLFRETNNFKYLEHPNGENLYNFLINSSEVKKEINEYFKMYNIPIIYDVESEEIKFEKKLDEDRRFNIQFYLIADTLKRLIFYKLAVRTNHNQILLFEEPEAHCFPNYTDDFIHDIVRDENNNQFFIITHSKHIINRILYEYDEEVINNTAFFISEINEFGETNIRKVKDETIIKAIENGDNASDILNNLNHF